MSTGTGPTSTGRNRPAMPRARVVLGLLASMIALGALVSPVANAGNAGELDRSFDEDGTITREIFGDLDEAVYGVAIQPDGKIITAGYWQNTGNHRDVFSLIRLHPDGSHDRSFGSGGIGALTLFPNAAAIATAVAIQPDGKIVAAGLIRKKNGDRDFALARYTPDGSLDNSFSGDGKLTTDFGGDDRAAAVAIRPDGKIVAAGQNRNGNGNDNDFALALYNPDGSLDTSFGRDGKQTTDFGGFDLAHAVAVQPDGRIVAAGMHTGSFALARYMPASGRPDHRFGDDGKLTTAFRLGNAAAAAVAIQPDGRIVAAGTARGTAGDDFAITRYRRDGSLDTSFAGDGKRTTDFGGLDRAAAVAIQADGKIVAAGLARTRHNELNFGLARYTRTGSHDITFSGNGRQTTDLGGADLATAVAIQPDGRIVAGGFREIAGDRDLALARYHAVTDNTAPQTTITQGPSGLVNAKSVTFRVASSEPESSFECKRDSRTFFRCGSITVFGGLDEGPHTVSVRATDQAGNTDPTPVVRSFTVDTVPPETGVVSGPSGLTNDPSPKFELSSSELGSSFECSLDQAPFETCTSPHALGPLADGTHTVRARTTDEAGNTDPTPAERSFTIDASEPPRPSDDTPPGSPPNDTSVTIRIEDRKLRFNRRRTAKATVTCPVSEVSPPCAGRLKLKTRSRVRFKDRRRRVVLAAATFEIGAGEVTRVKLKASRPKRKLLRHTKAARRARAIANVRDQAGNRAIVRKQLRTSARARRR